MNKTSSKKISAALACILSVSLLATACEQTSENIGGIPEISETTPAETSAPETTVEETTTAPETTTEATTTEETTETSAESETSVTEETAETEETSETAETASEWSETSMSGTMYIAENCYSREKAVIGATPISQLYTGDTIEIIALTDTGYYKLAEGGFVHSDYVTDSKPAETTVATTTAPAETEPEEFVTTKKPKPDSSDNTGNDTPSFGGGSSSGGEPITTPNYNIKSSSRYAYNQLSATEQSLYNRIVDAVRTLESVVEVPSGLTSDQVVKVYTIVYDSEPQLFWMGNTISAGTSFCTLSYKTTDRNEIKAMQSEIDSAASSIISKAKSYSGTVSKLKVFFDSIVYQSEFSKSESGYNCSIYNGLTARGALQCAGYAKTMQYLCDLSGIECCVVRGSDKDGNSHAWNVVYCDNGYYNLDSTWGDPINSFGSSYVQYEFFLVPDAWIHNITHYNVSYLLRSSGSVKLFTPPSCSKEGCNYFSAYNKLYSSKSEAESAMYAAIDDAIANKKNVAEVRVSSKSDYDSLMSDDYFRAFQKYAKGKSGSVARLQRQSSYTAGVQVVHYDIVYN